MYNTLENTKDDILFIISIIGYIWGSSGIVARQNSIFIHFEFFFEAVKELLIPKLY